MNKGFHEIDLVINPNNIAKHFLFLPNIKPKLDTSK